MRPYSFKNNQRIRNYTMITKAAICFVIIILGGELLPVFGQLGCIFLPSVWAKTEIVSDVLNGFKDWYGKVNSLKAEFHQTSLNPLWGEAHEARGEVWFKKPGLMNWKYLFPQQDRIIINQEGFFWYMPEDNQLIKREKQEAFRTISPMSILGENMQLERDFEIIGMEQICQGKDKNGDKKERELFGYSILLKPRNAEVAIKKISVEVRAEQFSLAAIEVEETSGSRNRIEFEKFEINQEMSPDLFKYIPSPDTKVITPDDFPSL